MLQGFGEKTKPRTSHLGGNPEKVVRRLHNLKWHNPIFRLLIAHGWNKVLGCENHHKSEVELKTVAKKLHTVQLS
jgi:hypothetical protein